MSLLSIDITKVRKLSTEDVKLPTPERRAEPTIRVDKPLTDEEITYNKLIKINPNLETLVERFGLVSCTTGEPMRKVDDTEKGIDKPKLISLAQRVIEKANNYSREEIIEKIIKATNVSQERAEKGFNLILEAGAIELTPGGRYYLSGSAPF